VSLSQTTNRPEPGTKGSRPVPPHTFILDGHRLRHLRRQRGLSQEDLADQAVISFTTVARPERQLHAPCRGWTLGRPPEHSASPLRPWLSSSVATSVSPRPAPAL